MKLLTFRKRGQRTVRLGAVGAGGNMVDLAAAYASCLYEKGEPSPVQLSHAYLPWDMVELIGGGAASRTAAQTALAYAEGKSQKGDALGIDSERLLLSREEIVFLPPILRPGKMISAGLNYAEHVNETARTAPEFPVAFAQFSSTFVGHEGEIRIPPTTRELDYEIELAVIIGRKGKYIQRDTAIDYVFGYTIHNDVSDRGLQRAEKKGGLLLGGKNRDTFAPIGPWIVTADEIADPHNLNLILRVNGDIRQQSNTRHMIFDVLDIIAYWSSIMTLYPGDIFSTGTPSGVAARRKPSPDPFYLKPGDIVEAEIEGVGVLRNRVVAEDRGHPMG